MACFALVFALVFPTLVTLPKAAKTFQVDVVFSFDISDSMSYYFAAAKSQALNMMAGLERTGIDAAFGVLSHMDYPHTYSSYGYGATYGIAASGDYAYRLDAPVTRDRTVISDALERLMLGSGSYVDPEDYVRVMYERCGDAAIGRRSGATRFLVMLCDSVPHDDNLNEGIPGKNGNLSTGGDPGPDEIMFTSDDLDLQLVLGQMTANQVILLVIRYIYLAVATTPYWQHWARLTGGEMYTSSNADGTVEDSEHGSERDFRNGSGISDSNSRLYCCRCGSLENRKVSKHALDRCQVRAKPILRLTRRRISRMSARYLSLPEI